MATREIEIHYDAQSEQQESGVEIPFERIDPETLRRLIGEFVTRQWEELGAAQFTLEEKIEQVHRQLEQKKAKVVFDLSTETANIVVVGR
jgi:uncharacterized protein YheU (UPF0270 family)